MSQLIGLPDFGVITLPPNWGSKMFEDKTTGMLQQNHSTRWLPCGTFHSMGIFLGFL